MLLVYQNCPNIAHVFATVLGQSTLNPNTYALVIYPRTVEEKLRPARWMSQELPWCPISHWPLPSSQHPVPITGGHQVSFGEPLEA